MGVVHYPGGAGEHLGLALSLRRGSGCIAKINEHQTRQPGVISIELDARTPKSTTTVLRRPATTFPECKSRSPGNRANSLLHASCVANSPTTQRATVQCRHGTCHMRLQIGISRETWHRRRTSDGGMRSDQRLMQNGPSRQMPRLSPPPGRRANQPRRAKNRPSAASRYRATRITALQIAEPLMPADRPDTKSAPC